MADSRRASRAVKAIDYARLDVGSDDEDDDDFQPVEVSTKNRKKVKGNSPAKERSKLQPEKRPSVHVADVTEVAVPKPKRLSLEEKLLDRDLKTALRLSQQGCAIADGRESGVPKVQKWEQRADAPKEEVAATVEIETTAVAGLMDVGTASPGSTALEDDGKQGVEVACQPASDAEEASTSDGSEESPPEPVKKRRNGGHFAGRQRRASSRALRFSCGFCSYSSDKKTDVKVHERTHTGERPFHCHLCPHKFSHKSNLTKHLRCHSGEKPFRCPVCGKRLGRKPDLERHLATHATRGLDPSLVCRP